MYNYIDLFGTTFKFSTFGETKFHTWLGFSLSIICLILTITFVAVFGSEVFNKITPRVVTENSKPLKYSLVNLTSKDFTFAWRIEDESGSSFNFTGILYPSISYYSYKKNETTKELDLVFKRIIEPKKCNNDTASDPLFQSGRSIVDWYCMDFTKEENSTIGGFWDGDFLYYYNIYLYYCPDNDRNSNKCTKLDDLKKLMISDNKLYFSILYPQYYFNPYDLQNALSYQYVNYYNDLSVNLQKLDRIFFKKIELVDDQGLLTTDYVNHTLSSFNKMQNGVSIKLDNDFNDKSLSSEMYSMILYYSKSKEKFVRSYMKVQELLAIVGGFMQIIYIAGKVLCGLYNDYQRNIQLINTLFEFVEPTHEVSEEKFPNIQLNFKKKISELIETNEIKDDDISPKEKIRIMKEKNQSLKEEIELNNLLKENMQKNQNINNNIEINAKFSSISSSRMLANTDENHHRTNVKFTDLKSMLPSKPIIQLLSNNTDENQINMNINNISIIKKDIKDSIVDDKSENVMSEHNILIISQNQDKDHQKNKEIRRPYDTDKNLNRMIPRSNNPSCKRVQNVRYDNLSDRNEEDILENLDDFNRDNMSSYKDKKVKFSSNDYFNHNRSKSEICLNSMKPPKKKKTNYSLNNSKDILMKQSTIKTRKLIKSVISCDEVLDKKALTSLKEEEISYSLVNKFFNLGFFVFLKKIFCNKQLSQKEIGVVKIYDFAYNYVKEKLDVNSYMKLLHYIDTILLIKFNDCQSLAFNYLKKPNLFNKHELELFDLDLNKRYGFEGEVTSKKERYLEIQNLTIIKYFIKLLKEDNFEEADEKLFDLLDTKYKKIILNQAFE